VRVESVFPYSSQLQFVPEKIVSALWHSDLTATLFGVGVSLPGAATCHFALQEKRQLDISHIANITSCYPKYSGLAPPSIQQFW
jgi:hypothetical protein